MRLIILVGVTLVLATGGIAAADHGRQVHYVGIHPIPKAEGRGTCYIEGPHVHLYPADKVQYRDHDGANYFVGDPVAYGYEGPKYAYKGHHPIRVDLVVGDADEDTEWCYLDGPHYHYFTPPPGPDFQVAGDAYFYVAAPPKAYLEARPMYIGINAVYEPLVYTRPVVTVAAPVGWIGATVVVGGPAVVVGGPPVVVAPAPRVRGGAVIVAPGVHIGAEVRVPAPSVHIGVGISGGAVIGGGVIVEEKRRGKRHK